MLDHSRTHLSFRHRDSQLLIDGPTPASHGIQRVAHERWAADMRVATHGRNHPGFYLVTAGRGIFGNGEERIPLRSGWVFSYGLRGNCTVSCDSRSPLEVRIVEFTEQHWGPRWRERCGDDAFALPIHNHQRLAGILAHMAEEAKQHQRFVDPLLSALGEVALSLCGRARPHSTETGAIGHQHVERAKRIIRTLIEQNPSLSQVAEVIGISPTHLSRLFRQHTGTNARNWLQEQRLRHAQHLLSAHPDLTLDAIASTIGYADGFTLSKAYKRLFGAAPRARQSHARKQHALR